MLLTDFRPQSKLNVKLTRIERPAFPCIDAHNHLGPDFGGGWSEQPAQQLIDVLDQSQINTYVDLDGGWGEEILQARLDKFKAFAPNRFCFFASPNWRHWFEQKNSFGAFAAKRLREQAKWGAQGLKIWKNFGLHVRDHKGALVAIDDPRLDELWQTAGELGFPVTIHIADPVAFFDPVDERNERWEELGTHPDWHFPHPQFPPFHELIAAFARLVRRHRNTVFIGAHVGCYAENLPWVSTLLDECSNFNIDFSARISELGRQPYSSKRFFERYSDRIVFGTDAGPSPETYRTYWRFLETEDEYFDYSEAPTPPQGRWRIYGLGLDKTILRKVYFENAERLILKKNA